jgi:hypothetical protein
MKNIFFIFLSLFSYQQVFSQYDTIYSNGERTACNVKEVTSDAVKFSYPNEDLINSVYKNTIQKIVFKSGRVEVFAEATSLRTVNSVDDYNNVSLSHVASEVQGLYKIGDVGAKARGTTIYANMEKVKERGIQKMKIQAAMMGGNVVYITQEATSNNFYGAATATNMAGVAYSNMLPNYDNFVSLLNNKMKLLLKYFQVDRLSTDDYDVVKFADSGSITINRVYNDNGFIMIDANVQNFDNKIFKVTYYSNEGFTLECTDNSDIFENTIYNIRIRL